MLKVWLAITTTNGDGPFGRLGSKPASASTPNVTSANRASESKKVFDESTLVIGVFTGFQYLAQANTFPNV